MIFTAIRSFSTKIPAFKPVSHIIFDIDGLILKTEQFYYQADKTVINRYGKEYPWELRMKVLGRTEQQTAHMIVEELKLPVSHKQYQTEVKNVVLDLLKNAPLMPGAERLIRHLYNNKIPMALATSSGAESVVAKFSKYQDLYKLFNHIVMASSDPDIKQGKPAPDVFLAAAKKFTDNPDPEKCLVFEDAPNGVLAAVSAGMQVVMVPEDYVSEEDRKKATVVLKSLNDFKPEQFKLPPFSV